LAGVGAPPLFFLVWPPFLLSVSFSGVRQLSLGARQQGRGRPSSRSTPRSLRVPRPAGPSPRRPSLWFLPPLVLFPVEPREGRVISSAAVVGASSKSRRCPFVTPQFAVSAPPSFFFKSSGSPTGGKAERRCRHGHAGSSQYLGFVVTWPLCRDLWTQFFRRTPLSPPFPLARPAAVVFPPRRHPRLAHLDLNPEPTQPLCLARPPL